MSETFNFEKQTYNGISIIRETTTCYVNASQMCSSNGKAFRQFKTTKQFKEIIEIYNEFVESTEIEREIQGVVFPTPYFDIDFTKEFQGTYIHPKLVHFIAEYCSKRYAFMVAELMDSINDSVHQRLNDLKLTETPQNANTVFNLIIDEQKDRLVSDNENKQCFGYRERDKFDYLDSWDKSWVKSEFEAFKKHLIDKLSLTFEELKRDYPQLID